MARHKKNKKTNGEDSSYFTKQHQVMIIVAIIGTSGIFFGGETYTTMWEERAIIEISFGGVEEFPREELSFDGTNYVVSIIGINRGNSQTDPLVTVVADGAKISFNKEQWGIQTQQNTLVRPNDDRIFFNIYIQPDKNTETFSISINKPGSILPHEVYLLSPSTLVFELNDGKFILSKSY